MKTISRIPYWYLIVIPILLIFSGFVSNQAVLVANWGKFPVMINERVSRNFRANCVEETARAYYRNQFSALDSAVDTAMPQQDCNGQFLDDVHSIMGHNSRLKCLADVINLGDAVASVGDLLLWLGKWLLSFTPLMWLALALRLLMCDREKYASTIDKE